ncbi:M20 family metallopeptidase [uncultured Ilyobacter sp.]|uniref:M20 metallopeptidase family protein n=1 Tax=uncultured Ilyobacter sp. TaxID=544433 RepID=UPI0029C95A0E|nr:M20 family metallopeptidase [uncultured Ilyobacter sp.]
MEAILHRENKCIYDRINELTKCNKNSFIEIRRHLHQHPELGYDEFETSKYIATILEKLGIEVQRGVAKTGVVGLLIGKYPGKTIAIRADMDALPINELNDFSYKSKYDGRMHACGHDAHMTFALGAAIVLSKLKDELHGNVKFIFQPAEETSGGAKPMIEEGVLENPRIDAIIGAHVWNIECGKFGIKTGPIMASTDVFEIKIIGKGGHAAQPQNAVDPIIIGSEIIGNIQNIKTRKMDPLEPVVISVCNFNAGETFNVIPNEAILRGTVRTLNPDLRKMLPQIIEKNVESIVTSYGATCEFKYTYNYPVTVNDNDFTDFVKNSIINRFGKDSIEIIERPSMGGEDFAFYLQKVPGTFLWVGIRNEGMGITQDIHHPMFTIDEEALSLAIEAYSNIVINFLNKIN